MRSEKIASFQEQLEALERDLVAELADEVAADSSIIVDNAIGRLTRMEAIQAQAMGRDGRHRQERRLQLVRRALQRLEEGSFGTCTQCGAEIPVGRLEIMPESGYCVACTARRA